MLALILSVLGVGGIGAAAFAFPPFGAALLGFLKPLGDFLAKIPWQVYVVASLIGVLGFLVINRGDWMQRAHHDETQVTTICTATRAASGNPRLSCKDTAAQIVLVGQAIESYRTALADQNAKVKALGVESAKEQKAAETAEKKAKKSSDEAQAVRDRLLQAARSAAERRSPADHCESLPAVKGQWQ